MTAPSSNATRAYAAAHFSLELDGSGNVGLFRSIEGGGVKTEVMSYQSGPIHEKWRQLGKPKFEDIKLQVGMSMGEPFFKWISKFFTGKAERKTGAIIAADFTYVERARRDFSEAMIKELTLPKLDASDKNPAYMTVSLAVEDIKYKKGSGKKLAVGGGASRQKLWTSANFVFELAGFEDACSRTTKIDSFTVNQQVIEYHSGGSLAPIKTPSTIGFPNIAFYVPEVDAQPFIEHFTNENKIAHKNDVKQASKLHGSITYQDSAKTDLFVLSFTGADIVNVSIDKSDANTDDIKLVKVEIYTEGMSFEYKPHPGA